MTAPLAGLRFSLVGPGKVGASLAQWAQASGAELVGVAARRSRRRAWPRGPACVDLRHFGTAGQDLLLVAVADGALQEVAAELARRPQAAAVLHTSGILDASVLHALREAGSAVGSLHPLKAFPRRFSDLEAARGVFFAIDGDAAAREVAGRLAAAWGGPAGEVPAAARPLYHFAATLAAGGVVTLLAAAAELAGRLGLPEEVAGGYLELAKGAVAAARQALDAGRPLAAAITGPAARDDRATLARHLEALAREAPEKLPLAMFLLLETLRQTGREPEDQKTRN